MIRVLLMITVAGFVLSIAALSAAVAIGGPEAFARGGWHVMAGHWDDDWWDSEVRRGHDGWTHDGGPRETRTLAWSGATRLTIDLPARVRYVQAPGEATVEITGPARAVERVVVRDDSLRYRSGRHRHRPRLDVVVRAPNISSFDIGGSNSLSIEGYRQERLNLDISGNAEVSAVGEAREVNLDISGSGEAELGDLTVRDANVDVSGSGDATIAPTESARLDISGSGDIRLLTNPPVLETEVSGSGRVRQVERAQPAASPVPPAKPATPAPQSSKL